jgi:hypothetical protein
MPELLRADARTEARLQHSALQESKYLGYVSKSVYRLTLKPLFKLGKNGLQVGFTQLAYVSKSV